MNIMMDKIVSSQLFPPGYDGESEYKRTRIFYWIAVVWSLKFFFHYYNAYKDLFYDASTMAFWGKYSGMGLEHGELLPDVKIVSFHEILSDSFLFFVPLLLVLAVSAISHYLYYSQGSRSILLVRRLPDSKYVWKTCVWGPALGLAITLVTMVVLLGIFYWIYVTVTPAVCLP